MILFFREDEGAVDHLILLVGAGLVGSVIQEYLVKHEDCHQACIPLDWTSRTLQESALEELRRYLAMRPECRVEVIWSAGKAGFSAGDTETKAELETFVNILGRIEDIARRAGKELTVTLISSAGGVYEGQRHVQGSSPVSPSRPYGQLKYQQEQHLAKMKSVAAYRIYRASTVYGYIAHNRRMGLISTLVHNCVRGMGTRIYGGLMTLRDYLWVEDLGRYVAQVVSSGATGDVRKISILACGKPSSIFEIGHNVESVTGRRCYISFTNAPDNDEDFTYSPSVVPAGLVRTDLKQGISRIYQDWQTR